MSTPNASWEAAWFDLPQLPAEARSGRIAKRQTNAEGQHTERGRSPGSGALGPDGWFNARGGREALAAELGVPSAQCAKALALRERAVELAARETAEVEKLDGRILTVEDPGCPAGLLQLSPPPPVIAVRGE